MGYHFTIKYKSDQSNAAVDSPSRRYEDNILDEVQQFSMAISTFHFDFIDVLCHENQTLADLLELHTCIQGEIGISSSFSSMNGLMLFRGRLMFGKDSILKKLLLKEFHETPTGAHVGIQRTYIRLTANFFFGKE